MIDVASLVALCNAILSGKKVVAEIRGMAFSSEEKELLIEAAESGKFQLMAVAQFQGTWVRAGRKDFLDRNDPATAARYLEAFRRLCERGLIVHEGGKLFMLTGTGFQKARELREKVKEE